MIYYLRKTWIDVDWFIRGWRMLQWAELAKILSSYWKAMVCLISEYKYVVEINYSSCSPLYTSFCVSDKGHQYRKGLWNYKTLGMIPIPNTRHYIDARDLKCRYWQEISIVSLLLSHRYFFILSADASWKWHPKCLNWRKFIFCLWYDCPRAGSKFVVTLVSVTQRYICVGWRNSRK